VIESVSYPADLTRWGEADTPFYLELYGEAEPVLTMNYAEVIPPGQEQPSTVRPTPVYEYWWTIGHGGHDPAPHHLFGDHTGEPIWDRLADPAGRMYLYFPAHGGWRVKELVATVKYLNPVADQKTWSARFADELRLLEPVISGIAAVGTMGAVPLAGVPVAGPALAGAAPYLAALAMMKAASVPPDAKGFEWHVTKVAFGSPHRGGVMQGVSWVLPKAMFATLGSRLTGSLALSFVPCRKQGTAEWVPEPLPALAHAVIYADGKQYWAPASNDFVELTIAPRLPHLPATGSPARNLDVGPGRFPQRADRDPQPLHGGRNRGPEHELAPPLG
jgi:hypothetical protein